MLSTATIGSLPAELYREVLSWMSAGEGVLLSLACKDLWAKRYIKDSDCLRKLRRETPRPDRLTYLLLMDKDLPDHVFCTACESFERRASPHFEQTMIGQDSYLTGKLDTPCTRAKGVVTVEEHAHTIHIRRRMLDLVIRAATLGDPFGLSTAHLRVSRSRKAYGINALRIQLELAGRTVTDPAGNHHLFIRSQQSVELDLHVDRESHLEASRIQACGHDTTRQRSLVALAMDALDADRGTLSHTSPVTPCPNCPSNLQIEVATASARCVFATVTLTAWRDLGPRGCHTNPVWNAQVTHNPRRPFARGTADYAFGEESLKDVWARGRE